MVDQFSTISFYCSCAMIVVMIVVFRSLALEKFRSGLFGTRAKWFDLANDPNSTLSFDSELYVHVEELLCGMLRYAHRVPGFIVLRISSKIAQSYSANQPISVQKADKAIARLSDPYTKQRATDIFGETPLLIHKYLLAKSLLYLLWTCGMFLHAVVRTLLTRDETVPEATESIVNKGRPMFEAMENYAATAS